MKLAHFPSGLNILCTHFDPLSPLFIPVCPSAEFVLCLVNIGYEFEPGPGHGLFPATRRSREAFNIVDFVMNSHSVIIA